MYDPEAEARIDRLTRITLDRANEELREEIKELRVMNAMLRGKVKYAEIMAEKLLEYMRGGK